MGHEDRLAVDSNSLQDTLSLCDACGIMRTVPIATRKQDDGEVFQAQYCAICWPVESERLRGQWDSEIKAWIDREMTSVEPTCAPFFGASLRGPLTWHGDVGEMPPVVAAFIRAFANPADPANRSSPT